MEFDFSELKKNGIQRVGELNPYITLACDLRCKYCYMYDFLVKPKNNKEIMKSDFLVSMVNYFSSQENGLDRMTLLGGEPTLHPDITEIINTVAKMPIRELRMTTNGIGLHSLNLDRLQPNTLDHVSISIDGIDSGTNNLTRGSGTFDRIQQTLGFYKQAGIELSINYTVTNNNIDFLEEVVPFFASKGASIINFHRASLDGNAYNNQNLLVQPSTWVHARDKLIASIPLTGKSYPGTKVRIPYIFLNSQQINELGYKPIQEQNYHSPQGGHRLIVFPSTPIGKGLCYMSSDLIGQPYTELGYLSSDGLFRWNSHENNELSAYKRTLSQNVSTDLKDQRDEINLGDLIRVSHSFKYVITT